MMSTSMSTGFVINYFKKCNLHPLIQVCGSVWVGLHMCLLPTWLCSRAVLVLLFFVIDVTSKDSYRKCQKFMASIDWYLIHPHSPFNLGISSKLSNACMRAYCLSCFPKTERVKWQYRQMRVKGGSTLTERQTGRESPLWWNKRRHGEGKTRDTEME